MRRHFHQRNKGLLTRVADKLQEMCDDVTFVGGAVIGFLITDPAASDARVTVDTYNALLSAIPGELKIFRLSDQRSYPPLFFKGGSLRSNESVKYRNACWRFFHQIIEA